MTYDSSIEILKSALSSENYSSDPNQLEIYGRDWLKNLTPNPSLILFPRSVDEIITIINICYQEGIAIVPSGGRTGLSGGATATCGEVVLSLEKLNRIIEIDPIDRTVTCQAGVITQHLQDEVAKHNLYFPIDFASKGSSQIGGNIATNAGGIRVIRYGNIREWVVGLKAITGDGKVLNLNKRLFKDQTGLDLKSIIIGSEGTLAVITEITLKLVPQPLELIRIIGTLDNLENVLELLRVTRSNFSTLSAFEYISEKSLELVLQHQNLPHPLNEKGAHYVLIEFEEQKISISSQIEEFFYEQIEKEILKDAVISQSSKQSHDFMQYRELIPEIINTHYSPHKNDISVPISSIPNFVSKLEEIITKQYPEFRVAIFGHVGDGNLHINVMKPNHLSKEDFLKYCKEVDQNVFSLVRSFNGSISAEHGVGLLKKDFLTFSRSQEEIELMRSIKRSFDPKGILNRGKIFDWE